MEALHSSTKMDDTQFYVGCAQLRITGSGGGNCGPTIQLPGAYKPADTNIYISNFYYGFKPATFKAPGGPVATCGRGVAAPKPTDAAAPAPSSEPETAPEPSAVAMALPTVAPPAPSPPPTSRSTSQRTRARPTRTRGQASSESAAPETVSLYGRCGGEGYDGPTACEAGAACVEQNQFYSQCVSSGDQTVEGAGER